MQWFVDSFGQDLIYAVTCGKQKPPKHILLASAVKSLTGNVELKQALNRLGHTVSYDQIEENETGLCLLKMASSDNARTLLPEDIHPHVFTTMALDNIDLLEETVTGHGTSHRVNGIIVQPTVYGPHLSQTPAPSLVKCKKRSIFIEDLNLLNYNSGDRAGPGVL